MQVPAIRDARENNFNIIRLIAVLMVIAGQMGFIAASPVPMLLGQGIHIIGVKIFFVIGGYLIAKSWMSDPDPIRYAIKRVSRIFPALAACVLFTALIAGPLLSTLTVQEYFDSPTVTAYLKNIALYINYALPGVFAGNPYPNAVNGSLWTLPVGAFCYVLVPILLTLSLAKKRNLYSRIAMTLIVLLVCAFQLLHMSRFPDWHNVVYLMDIASAFTLIPYYLIGVLYAQVVPKKLLSLPIAAVLVLYLSCFNLSEVKKELALFLVLPYFTFSLAFAPQARLSKWLEKREITYGIYLYSFFVQQATVYLTIKDGHYLSPTIYFILCSLISAALALVSNFLVEKPFLYYSGLIMAKIRPKKNAA